MAATPVPAYILKLPPEVACEIFHEACTPPPDVPAILRCKVYNDRCTRLRHTHPDWWSIIADSAAFWTKLHLDCYTVPEQLLHHLSFVGPRLPLDVTMNFDLWPAKYIEIVAPTTVPASASALLRSCDHERQESRDAYTMISDASGKFDGDMLIDCSSSSSSSDDGVVTPTNYFEYVLRGVTVRDCLLAVSSSVSRWKNVYIRTPTDHFLGTILDVLGDLPGSGIHSLVFECPAEDNDPRSCVPVLAEFRPLFNAVLPLLYNIQLIGAPVPFTSHYFGNLRFLAIRDLPSELWPSVHDFTSALTSSSFLEELEIGGGGVDFPMGSPPAPTFVVPSLKSLKVFADDQTTSTLRLLKSAICPLLRTLHFIELGVAEWYTMASNSAVPFLESIKVSGWTAASIQVQVFLLRCHSVVHLDVAHTTEDFVKHLARCPGLCPRLRSLEVGSVRIPLLVAFARARQPVECLRITSIILHHAFQLPLTFEHHDSLCVLRMYVPDLVTIPNVL
ncbi:hypothetical protein C8R47DRAFT_1066474 [Mycena vitilis]|nr:hypothetical protein C8R47DRAFT_1066474 [Mycena vitilis]